MILHFNENDYLNKLNHFIEEDYKNFSYGDASQQVVKKIKEFIENLN